jgi:hypothetical protein
VLIGTAKGLRLFLSLALFLGWMSYLGYAALTKSRSPIVSHIQVAAAPLAIVAELQSDKDGKPLPKCKVAESLEPGSPAAGREVTVTDLPAANGFEGPGQYLLLLQRTNPFQPDVHAGTTPEQSAYALVGPQRSPGDVNPTGKPLIYPWNEDVRSQFQVLHR